MDEEWDAEYWDTLQDTWHLVFDYLKEKLEYYEHQISIVTSQYVTAFHGKHVSFTKTEKVAFKRVFSELHLRLDTLESFWQSNKAALHDLEIRFRSSGAALAMDPELERRGNVQMRRLEQLKGHLHKQFARLEPTYDSSTISNLIRMVSQEKYHRARTIYFRGGLTVMLLLSVAWDVFAEYAGFGDDFSQQYLSGSSLMFQALASICLCYWALALMVNIWTAFGINFGYVLQLQYNMSWSAFGIVDAASVVSAAYLVGLELYYKHGFAIIEARESGTTLDPFEELVALVPGQFFALLTFIFIAAYTLVSFACETLLCLLIAAASH